MSKTSKVVSMLLIVAMLVSVVAVGIVVSSAATPKSFFIVDSQITDDTGSWLPDDSRILVRTANEKQEEYFIENIYLTPFDSVTGEGGFKCGYSSKNGQKVTKWYPDGVENNISVPEAGYYDILFRPNGDGESDWFYSPFSGDGTGLEPHGCTVGGYMFKATPHASESTIDEPTEAPTEAPSEAPTLDPSLSTVTLVDWDGTETVKVVEVGDEIEVYAYLTLPEGKRLEATDVWETFNVGDEMLEFAYDTDADEEEMLPIMKSACANLDGNVIKANFTTAKFNNSYEFPDEDSILLKAKYKVVAEGRTKIEFLVLKLATISSDDAMANQISENVYEGTDELTLRLSFDAPVPAVLKGDLNGDGQVNNRDAIIMDRYVAGWEGYESKIVDMKAADLNNDGQVNNRDAMIMDRYIAGWEGYDKYFAA